jgi:NNP family nitrate/nitrite transporter-like MFS transporter
MTYLYLNSLGSFIGYSAALPLLIKEVFGYLPDGSVNTAMADSYRYAWVGPFTASFARTFGGYLADRLNSSSTVKHYGTLLKVASNIGAGYFVQLAASHEAPETYFAPFLVFFLFLFTATGLMNGSTFRQIPILFEPEQAGPVLGWVAAIGAYGAAVFPVLFGTAPRTGKHTVLYLLAIYDFSCTCINYYFYYRKNAPRPS